jgi:polar amino acid transport system substrate-binding protein
MRPGKYPFAPDHGLIPADNPYFTGLASIVPSGLRAPLIRRCFRPLTILWLACSILVALVARPAAAQDPLVIVSPESRPYAYREGDVTKGVLHDLVTEAFRRAHRPIEIRFFPWARCMEEVRKGRADAMFVMYKTAEREQDFAFPAESLTDLRERIFVRRNANFELLDDFSNFTGRRIGILTYTVHGQRLSQAIAQHRIASLESVSSYEAMVDMLASGHVDLLIGVDDAIIDAIIARGLQDRIREIDPVVDTIPAYMVFARRPDLVAVSRDYDQALHEMKADGTYDRIAADYPRLSLKDPEAARP